MNFIFEYFQNFYENTNYALIMWPLIVTSIVIFTFMKKKKFSFFESKTFKNVKNNLNIENKREVNYMNKNKIVNLNNNDPYSTWFNNCIEWSCFNSENSTKFNSFLLKSLNDSVNKFFLNYTILFYSLQNNSGNFLTFKNI